MRPNNSKGNIKNQDFARLAFSVPEVAEAIGFSLQKVEDLIKNGDLAHFRVGTRVLVSSESLQRLNEQRAYRPVIQNSWEGEP